MSHKSIKFFALVGIGLVALVAIAVGVIDTAINSRLPKLGWWRVTLQLNEDFEGRSPCPLYANIKEKKIRVELIKESSKYSLRDEQGNIYPGWDEGSSAINFDKGKESFSLGYMENRATSTYMIYMPNTDELKNLPDKSSCFTRYAGQAVPEL